MSRTAYLNIWPTNFSGDCSRFGNSCSMHTVSQSGGTNRTGKCKACSHCWTHFISYKLNWTELDSRPCPVQFSSDEMKWDEMMMMMMTGNDRVTAQARQETVKESSAERGWSSDDYRTETEMVQMLQLYILVARHNFPTSCNTWNPL